MEFETRILLIMLFSLLFIPSMTSFLSVLGSVSEVFKKSRHSSTLSKWEVMGVEQEEGW